MKRSDSCRLYWDGNGEGDQNRYLGRDIERYEGGEGYVARSPCHLPFFVINFPKHRRMTLRLYLHFKGNCRILRICITLKTFSVERYCWLGYPWRDYRVQGQGFLKVFKWVFVALTNRNPLLWLSVQYILPSYITYSNLPFDTRQCTHSCSQPYEAGPSPTFPPSPHNKLLYCGERKIRESYVKESATSVQ